MNGAPEISIVVPVYKGVRFLREALASVRSQTFGDWECLCVDDGSRDGSGALLDELVADEPRFRVFHRENGGTSVARNFALSQARGRYIAFLDEDDVYRPQMLEVLHAAAEKTGADVVGCEFEKFGESDAPSFAGGLPDEGQWKTADSNRLREWVSAYYEGVPFEVWRNLYRRELIGSHMFRPGVRVEQDLLWHYTLLPKVGTYVRIPWTGYGWRRNSTGGYLHPDAASLVSLVESSRMVYDAVCGEMGLSPDQTDCFRRAMAADLKLNVWEPLHDRIAPNREEVARLRRGFAELEARGVDSGVLLRGIRRLKWRIFLACGWTGCVRK